MVFSSSPTTLWKLADNGLNNVRKMLLECKIKDLRFGVVYPAEMRITLPDGTVVKFKDSREAKDYVLEKVITKLD